MSELQWQPTEYVWQGPDIRMRVFFSGSKCWSWELDKKICFGEELFANGYGAESAELAQEEAMDVARTMNILVSRRGHGTGEGE